MKAHDRLEMAAGLLGTEPRNLIHALSSAGLYAVPMNDRARLRAVLRVAATALDVTLTEQLREGPIDIEDVPWLIKDFDVLYRAALDVSASSVNPDRETPPQRYLRAQLDRLRPAFDEIAELKAMIAKESP